MRKWEDRSSTEETLPKNDDPNIAGKKKRKVAVMVACIHSNNNYYYEHIHRY